ncbi:hypothetical protein AB6N01_04220 [Alcaligenes nematophilus]|uniref:hypothetical protein n=1 Tax=Alcaligenes nematophilus TaxID=2994643 RepID=UPI0034E0D892
MISEKTIELNLTTETINYAYTLTGRTHFAVGLTQKEEATYGVDVSIGGGLALLLQYKRAHIQGNIWTWHLNRTKDQDQHLKLQTLESLGYPVYYALPYFSTLSDIQANRRKLLLKTFAIRPSTINPVPGPTGYHDIRYDSSTGLFSVHSEPTALTTEPEWLKDIIEKELTQTEQINIGDFCMQYNKVVLGLEGGEPLSRDLNSDELEVFDVSRGAAIIGSEYV